MANYYADNYKGAFIDKPSKLAFDGAHNGKRRSISDSITLPAATAVNDLIYVGKLPENAIILGGAVLLSKSLGATGIFDLIVKDSAGAEKVIVKAADGGGQAAFKSLDVLSEVFGQRYTGDVYLKCTEVMDGSVADALMRSSIEYAVE